MKQTPYISVVIPVFNETENIAELLRRCLDVCTGMGKPFEIILVDDGSSDGSREFIIAAAKKNYRQVVAVIFNRNYGQHAAVMAGFSQAAGDIVVTLDADLQNPPEEIPKLINKIEQDCDVVGSVRTHRRDSRFRKLASAMVNHTVRKATGVMMHDYGCMLRAYRRPIVNAMLQCHERSTFIPVLANRFARRTAEIEVQHEKRSGGTSKYSLWKLIGLQFDLVTSMTTFPLRMLSIMGVLVSGCGISLSAYLILMRIIYGSEWAVQGVFTLFAVLFVFIGALFIGLGLLGEYLGRVYDDVRARPRYFIHQIIGRPETDEKIGADDESDAGHRCEKT